MSDGRRWCETLSGRSWRSPKKNVPHRTQLADSIRPPKRVGQCVVRLYASISLPICWQGSVDLRSRGRDATDVAGCAGAAVFGKSPSPFLAVELDEFSEGFNRYSTLFGRAADLYITGFS